MTEASAATSDAVSPLVAIAIRNSVISTAGVSSANNRSDASNISSYRRCFPSLTLFIYCFISHLSSSRLFLAHHFIASSNERALFTVSLYSNAGMDSLTIPAPACTYAFPSFTSIVRMANAKSILPLKPI